MAGTDERVAVPARRDFLSPQQGAANVLHVLSNHLLLIGSEGATPFKDAGIDVMQDPTTMPLY